MAISIELKTKYLLETAGSERQKRERRKDKIQNINHECLWALSA